MPRPAPRFLRLLPITSGVSVALLGAIVLGGWLLQRPAWIQLRPGSRPMEASTATAIVLCGLGLVALHVGWRRTAAYVGWLVALLAFFVFAPYAWGIDLGLDRLLFQPWVGGADLPPGRMAPNTALAAILAGLALPLTSRSPFVGALLGSLVFTLGAVATLGYLLGVQSAFAWGDLTHMAPHTALALGVLGVGISACAVLKGTRRRTLGASGLPFLVAVAATVAGLLFWQALRGEEQEQVRRSAEATARGLAAEIQTRTTAMAAAVEHLAALEGIEDLSPVGPSAGAFLLEDAFAGFEALEWIGAERRLLSQRRLGGRLLAPEEEPSARAMREAAHAGGAVVHGPLALSDGESAVAVTVPVIRGGRVVGHLFAVYSARGVFGPMVENLAPRYTVELACQRRPVFSAEGENRRGPAVEVALDPPGPLPWSLTASPPRSIFAGQQTGLPELALGASLLIALLLALTVRFALVARGRAERFEIAVQERTAELEEATAALRRENAERRRTAETLRQSQQLARIISGELDLGKVVQAVTDAATQLTGAAYGAFFYNLIDEQGEAYQLYALSGAPREAFASFPLPRNTAIFGPTFSGESPVRIADVRRDSRYGKNDPHHGLPSGHLPVTSYLAVPVIARSGEVHGGLFFGHPDPGVFTGRSEEIAVSLAAQAAIAIDNARLYDAERRAKAEAEAANAAKDRFLAMLGHELRNPLGSIQTALAVVERRPEDESTYRQMRGIVDRQVGHLTRLVDDLLDVSRIERGKQVVRAERLDLGRPVHEALEAARPQVENAQLDLEVELPEQPLWVDGDATRLVQVVGNLVANSVKFTDRGGRITVSASREGEEAVVRVRDTGCGIEAGQLPRMFEPFIQTDAALDRAAGGLGLGLPIVKGLIEAQGGRVEARSDGIGQGAEFSFRLPLKPPPALRAPETAPQRVAAPRKVLVIDDHPDSAQSLAELLRLSGNRVELAYDGPSGLARARHLRPDVVICDIRMPGMDGYEVAQELRRDPATNGACLLALTGYGDDESSRRALESGFDRHMTKPVDSAELLRRVAEAATGLPPPDAPGPSRAPRAAE